MSSGRSNDWSWTRWNPTCTEGFSVGRSSGSHGAGVGAPEG